MGSGGGFPISCGAASHTQRFPLSHPLAAALPSESLPPPALPDMIHFMLLQNRQGKTRLSKYYSPFSHDEQKQLQSEVHRLVTRRSSRFTNFVEFKRYKLVYRRYAGLFFTLCVDVNDNELVYLESIHLWVELLDKFFGSVTELDIVFNFHKVYALLDEFFLGGEVQETCKRKILERLSVLEKLE